MNGKHIIGHKPKQPRAFKMFPPTIYRTQTSLTQTLRVSLSRGGGGGLYPEQPVMKMCMYDLCFFPLCFLQPCSLPLLCPAARPTDPVPETMTPVCCWGSPRKWRTRGRQTSSPAGHVTPGSGTAVTSESNVVSVLSTSASPQWPLACIICSHWPTCWHQWESCMKSFHFVRLQKTPFVTLFVLSGVSLWYGTPCWTTLELLLCVLKLCSYCDIKFTIFKQEIYLWPWVSKAVFLGTKCHCEELESYFQLLNVDWTSRDLRF